MSYGAEKEHLSGGDTLVRCITLLTFAVGFGVFMEFVDIYNVPSRNL